MAQRNSNGISNDFASKMLLGAVSAQPIDEAQRLSTIGQNIDRNNIFSAKELLIPENATFKAKYDEVTKRGAIGDVIAGSVNVHDKITQSLADATSFGIKSVTGVDSVTQGVYERQARKRLKQEEELQQVGEAAGVHPSLLYALPEIATSIAPVARLGVLSGATMAGTIAKTASANMGAEFAVGKLLGETNENAMWNAIGAGGIMAPIGAASHLLSAKKVSPKTTPETQSLDTEVVGSELQQYKEQAKATPFSDIYNKAKDKASGYSNDFQSYAKDVDNKFRTYSTKNEPIDDALDTEIVSDNKYKQSTSDAYTKVSDTVQETFGQAKQFVKDTGQSMDNFDIDGFAQHIKSKFEDVADSVGETFSKPNMESYVNDIKNMYNDMKTKMTPDEFVSTAQGYLEHNMHRSNNLDVEAFTRQFDEAPKTMFEKAGSRMSESFDNMKTSFSKLGESISKSIDDGIVSQSFKDTIANKLSTIFDDVKGKIKGKDNLPSADDGFSHEPNSLGSKLGQEANLRNKIEIGKDEINTFRQMNNEAKIEKITEHYFPEIHEGNAQQAMQFKNELATLHEKNPQAFKELEDGYIKEKEYSLQKNKAQLRGKFEGFQSGKASEAGMTALERRAAKRKSQEKIKKEQEAKDLAAKEAADKARKEKPENPKIDYAAEDKAKAKHQEDIRREVASQKKKTENAEDVDVKKVNDKHEQMNKEYKDRQAEEPKQKKMKDADVDSTSYAINTHDLADVKSAKGTIGLDKNTVKNMNDTSITEMQKLSEKNFTAPDKFEFLSNVYNKYKGYFNPNEMTTHVKGVLGSKKHAEMIATYMHESLHKAVRDSSIMKQIEDMVSKFKDEDFKFTKNEAYASFSKSIQLEEELVHYSSVKASIRYMEAQGIDVSTVFNKIALDKLKAFEKVVEGSDELKAISAKMDYLLFHGSTREGSFLKDFMYGKKDIDNNIANTMYGIDKDLSAKLPRMKSESLPYDNSTFRSFMSSVDSSSIAKELDKISAMKKAAEDAAVVASTAIRERIHSMIPDKAKRASMTEYVLRTDYHAIDGIKTQKDAIKLYQDIDVRLSKSMTPEQFARLSEMTKHLARGMSGDLNALNSPMMLSNALAIAKRTGLKNIPDEMIKDIDKKITIQALAESNRATKGDTWKFIEANADKKWFQESIGLIKYKNELSKEMFASNKFNYNKGYSKESYSSPYIYGRDEWGNTTKTLDNDLGYAEGAIPVDSPKTKGSQVFEVPEHMKNATEEAKEVYALTKQFGVVLDTNGNISKFRKHLLSKEGKLEAGLESDFADVMADTFSGVVKKKGIERDFIPEIKKSIEDGSSELMSKEPKEGYVKVDDNIKKLLPYELQDVINYVKPEFKQSLLGNIEVGYNGKNDLIKTTQAIIKDTVSNFKENVVLKNPVSWLNAMMFNVSVGLQHGIPMKFMTRNMHEGVKSYSQMRDIQRKLFMGVADGTLSVAEQGRLQGILDNNLLFQLNKEGMTMTIAAEIAAHPAFSKRLMDRMAFDRLSKFVGKEQAEKISTIWKNIYLHPHSKTGQFAIDTMTKIDVMGRYALAKHKMVKEGVSVGEAARFANSQFGDFNKVLPIWIQYIQEFGAIPFAGWFFRVAAGLSKSAYDNPAKTLALTAGLYALQQSTGERTESWSPIMTLATAPMGMVTMSPYLNPESTAQKSKVPEVYSKAYKSIETGDMSRMAISPSF